jgi:hypothetical protein
MKLNFYILYICFLTLPCFAQLLPGDIAIVSYNADGVEEFSFVTTVDIPGGEVLKFTDNGWLNTGSFRGGEGTITWTAPPTGVPCGTIVRFNGNVADAGLSSGSMALAGSGDQILVYQGSSAAPSFVYALNNEGSKVWQANATNSNTSSLPTGLLDGFSAVALQEVDNIAYDGTLTSGSRALVLGAISDFNNWTGGTNSTPPSPLSYTAAPFSISDCASTATIGFDAAASTDTEGNTLLIPISLSNATVFPVSVQINATLLTAELGDFVYTTTLTFNTNTTQNLSVSLVQDADADDETFELTLIETTATGVTIGNGSQTTTIVDDEIIPANINNYDYSCTSSGSVNLTWTNPSGSFDGIVILGRASSSPTGPGVADDEITLAAANTDFGAASNAWGSNAKGKVLYNGTGNSLNITGLSPGVTYIFKAFSYNGNSATLWSNGTQKSVAAVLNTVENEIAGANSNVSVVVNWTNPDGNCFDEVMVVVNETAGINFSPLGNGSAYSANTSYTAADQVVYMGTGTTVLVNNLVAGTPYYFEIFVRLGTEWSSGIEVQASPSPQLKVGDLVIIGFDNSVSGSTDRLSLTNLIDLEPGTKFGIANMVYEAYDLPNQRSKNWYSCTSNPDAGLAAIEITYTGTSNIPKGSILCFDLTASMSPPSAVEINGSVDPNFVSSYVGSTGSVNISTSSPDALFLVQGAWVNQGTHQSLDGTVLGGIQDGGAWYDVTEDMSAHTTATQKRRSRIPPEIQCFAISGSPSPQNYAAYYDNPLRTGTTLTLLSSIVNFGNWNTTNTALPGIFCSDVFFVSAGAINDGLWTGASDNDWFNCTNWSNLEVPHNSTDVVIDAANASIDCVVDKNSVYAPEYGSVARSNNLTIKDLTLRLAGDTDSLFVQSNLTLEAGSSLLDMNEAGLDGHLLLAGNWINLADRNAFDQGEGNLYFVGASNQSILTADAAGVENFYNLTVRKSVGTLQVSCSELTIDNNMNFITGVVQTTASQSIVFDENASATNASNLSYIDGPVVKQTSNTSATNFIFPTGKGGILGPIEITTSTFDGEFFSAEYFNFAHPDAANYNSIDLGGVSPVEYWNLDDLLDLGTTTNVTLHWGPHSGISNLGDLKVGHYFTKAPNPSNRWEDEGNTAVTGSLSNGTIRSNTVSSYSPFTLATIPTTLPLELIRFDVQKEGTTAQLNWTVDQEESNTFYTIERSNNGYDFESIGQQQGTGVPNSLLYYQWVDQQPLPGANYYRIRFNEGGIISYSEIRFLNFDYSYSTLVYPNPCSKNLQLQFATSLSSKIDLEMVNMLGQVVLEQSVTPLYGMLSYTLNIDLLAKGTYILHLKSGGYLYESHKITKD